MADPYRVGSTVSQAVPQSTLPGAQSLGLGGITADPVSTPEYQVPLLRTAAPTWLYPTFGRDPDLGAANNNGAGGAGTTGVPGGDTSSTDGSGGAGSGAGMGTEHQRPSWTWGNRHDRGWRCCKRHPGWHRRRHDAQPQQSRHWRIGRGGDQRQWRQLWHAAEHQQLRPNQPRPGRSITRAAIHRGRGRHPRRLGHSWRRHHRRSGQRRERRYRGSPGVRHDWTAHRPAIHHADARCDRPRCHGDGHRSHAVPWPNDDLHGHEPGRGGHSRQQLRRDWQHDALHQDHDWQKTRRQASDPQAQGSLSAGAPSADPGTGGIGNQPGGTGAGAPSADPGVGAGGPSTDPSEIADDPGASMGFPGQDQTQGPASQGPTAAGAPAGGTPSQGPATGGVNVGDYSQNNQGAADPAQAQASAPSTDNTQSGPTSASDMTESQADAGIAATAGVAGAMAGVDDNSQGDANVGSRGFRYQHRRQCLVGCRNRCLRRIQQPAEQTTTAATVLEAETPTQATAEAPTTQAEAITTAAAAGVAIRTEVKAAMAAEEAVMAAGEENGAAVPSRRPCSPARFRQTGTTKATSPSKPTSSSSANPRPSAMPASLHKSTREPSPFQQEQRP